METRLRNFSEEHIREDCRDITGIHSNALFYGCEFEKLNKLTLAGCDLNRSKFTTDHIRDALGFTMTLSCLSFNNVEYSELLFDMFLTLATLTSGNDEKREQLKDVVGRERYEALVRVLKATE
jgi:hypothetical protein